MFVKTFDSIYRDNWNRANGLLTTDIWIGLTGPPNVASWGQWDDLSSYDFTTGWKLLEPNGSGGCVAAKVSNSYEWGDEDCGTTIAYTICVEKPLREFIRPTLQEKTFGFLL